MNVYGGEYGRLLWSHALHLSFSEPIKNQLTKAVQQLVKAFIASIPYQGFVVVDDLAGKAVSHHEGKSIVKVNIGMNAKVEVGDEVQFIKIRSDKLQTIFDENLQVEVFAEGEILEKGRREVKVGILQVTDISYIVEGTLVRLPKELKRLQDLYAFQSGISQNLGPEYFFPGMSSIEEEENKKKEKKPLFTSISFLVNIVVFLLLAF